MITLSKYCASIISSVDCSARQMFTLYTGISLLVICIRYMLVPPFNYMQLCDGSILYKAKNILTYSKMLSFVNCDCAMYIFKCLKSQLVDMCICTYFTFQHLLWSFTTGLKFQ